MEEKNEKGFLYMDQEGLMTRMRGNAKLVKRLLDTFLADQEMEKLIGFVADDNREEANKSTHAIKGVAGNLSLTALFEASKELEADLKAGADVKDLFETYKTTYQKTREAVEEATQKL